MFYKKNPLMWIFSLYSAISVPIVTACKIVFYYNFIKVKALSDERR
jgi:hypothetical protein